MIIDCVGISLYVKNSESKYVELIEIKSVPATGSAGGTLETTTLKSPKKTYKSGDEVRVFIKEIKENRIALSVLFDDENPWNGADEKYAVGNIVKGVVARMTDFGAFIELEQGIDALMHVSQISLAHVNKPSDVLKIGQDIEAKVIDFNGETKKISLSLKAIELDNKAAEEAAEETVEEVVEEAAVTEE